MMIRPSIIMGTNLWIVLLFVWSIHHVIAQGAPHTLDTNYNGMAPGPHLETDKRAKNVLHRDAKQNTFQDIQKSWNKGQDEANNRYPIWNPLLVGLIKGYLSHQRTKKIGFQKTFIKEFKYVSKDSVGTAAKSDTKVKGRALPKRNKKQRLKSQGEDLARKQRGNRRPKREVYQGENGLFTESQSKIDKTLSSRTQVLLAGQDEQRLYYGDHTDFRIPLHDPRNPTMERDMHFRSNKLSYIFYPFNKVFHHQRTKRDTYDAKYRSKTYYANNDNGYSSFPKFSDPFHPLAYPMKESSYSPDAKDRKSVLFPFDSATSFYDNDKFYRKKRNNKKHFQQMKGSAKNFDFFDRPFRSSSSRYSGNRFGSSRPKFSGNSYRGSYRNSGNHYRGSSSGNSFGDSFSSSNSGFDFPSFGDTPSFSNFGNGYNNHKSLFSGDAKTSLNGLSSNIDLTNLAALYGNLFRSTANTVGDTQGALPRVNPVAQTPVTNIRVVDPTIAAPTVPMPAVTPTMARLPVTPPMTTRAAATIPPVTSSPCDAFFTSPSPGSFTTRRPCYYMPRTDMTTAQPTTTTCYDTHGTEELYPHYHPTDSPSSYDGAVQAEPAYSEFEIISQGLWDEDTHRETVTSPRPALSDVHNRRFLITQKPTVSRFITSPSPYSDNSVSENDKISPEILDMSNQLYPSAPQKAPRITGTIELKREKNKKPSFLVKLPFDTGNLPFAIRRLILSRFRDWPRTKGARNLASVTMNPLCPEGNATCSQHVSMNADGKALEKNVDIIAEVDPALFDKERLRQAFLLASSSRTQNALDLEEMEPSLRRHLADVGEQGLAALSEGDRANPATRYLQLHEPLGAAQPGGQDDDDVNSQSGLSEESWQKMMSPSTSNPLWEGANHLPSETPGWLRGIIKRFTTDKKWGTDGIPDANEGDVPRLLPALQGLDLDNHVETLPNPSHLTQSSGTYRVAGFMHWWLILAFCLSYFV